MNTCREVEGSCGEEGCNVVAFSQLGGEKVSSVNVEVVDSESFLSMISVSMAVELWVMVDGLFSLGVELMASEF